ncbi:endolytic transglycosylase MltG [Streptomyces noursei]|uniref:Endolytic murein transglycosylase n=1 Tax=Streptomyces noursei TaxID=1971 RepID=A0A401R403_STRNR|nr:endolytic transglycosylase MltG [Streptomyces noursei]UWS73359.1 endolytic transglycosylase MltG [Streptomyces noursei]GCB92385.1 aminodeoxychorismate lyase [Streptomyces noursei]
MSDVQHTGHRPGPRISRAGWLLLGAVLCVVVALVVLIVPRLLRERQSGQLAVPEGQRASQIYAAVDRALKVPAGTTAQAAKTARLDLPAEAQGNPEGYLFPATYPLRKDTTPASLLTYMVKTADQRLAADRVTSYRTVVIASIVQAEADRPADMGKVARVIDNRLARNMPLQMDSTINYALGRSTLRTSHADTRTNSPYNTYKFQGLPPTPIDNPGADALKAAATPPAGDWLYFVTVKPGDTRFTADYREHLRNVQEFNNSQKDTAAGDTSAGG